MRKFLAISLALVLLASNIGLAMSTHYCGGQAVAHALAIGTPELGCGMEGDGTTLCDRERMEGHSLAATPCCQEKHQLLQSGESFKSQSALEIPALSPQVMVVAQAMLAGYFASKNIRPLFNSHSPPLRHPNLMVLFQTFLL